MLGLQTFKDSPPGQLIYEIGVNPQDNKEGEMQRISTTALSITAKYMKEEKACDDGN